MTSPSTFVLECVDGFLASVRRLTDVRMSFLASRIDVKALRITSHMHSAHSEMNHPALQWRCKRQERRRSCANFNNI